MRTKKRKKTTRQRGSHTHGRGFMKKARGKGHRGGIGQAGSGKRADHKKDLVNNGFGKSKTLRRGKVKVRLETINLDQIQSQYAGKKEINLENYKVLSRGDLSSKITIKASAASAAAIEKVKKAGGELVILN